MGTSGANTPVGGRSGSATPRVEWEGFDFNTANSSVAQLRFAEGDVGTSKVSFGFWNLDSRERRRGEIQRKGKECGRR